MLKRRVTENFYRHALKRIEPYEPRSALEIQEFVDAEHAETTYDPKYHGWYDDRFIDPADPADFPADPWPADKITAWLTGWPADGLASVLAGFREKQQNLSMLHGLKSGELKLKGATFRMCNRDYSMRDLPGLIQYHERRLKYDTEDISRIDREVYLAYGSIARTIDQWQNVKNRQQELTKRYQFHLAIQGLLKGMVGEQGRLQGVLDFLSAHREVREADFYAVQRSLDEIRQSILDNLEDAKKFTTPALTNVPTGTSLYAIIVDRGDTRLERLYGDNISAEWVTKLIGRLDGVVTRIRRLHYKSLGSLLLCQETLAAEWKSAGDGRQQREGAETTPSILEAISLAPSRTD